VNSTQELQDLRREIRDAREFVPLLTDELLAAEVARQLDVLSATTKEAMQQSTQRVIEQFDRLAELLLHTTRRDRRTGADSLSTLVNALAGQPGPPVVPDTFASGSRSGDSA
jgi:hypothetical protein